MPEACVDVAAAEYRWGHRPVLTSVHSEPVSPPIAPGSGLTPPLGGIVLPTSRDLTQDLPGLRLGARLALANNCPLFVVISQAARDVDFPESLRRRLGTLLVIVRLDDVDVAWRPKLESCSHYLSTLERANDVGGKRNLGVQAAIVFGWATMLFLDDDISPAVGEPTLDEDGLYRGQCALAENPGLMAVGWTSEDFNDNSVIGHARPYCGKAQGVFIGGGALLVRCGPRMPFFPDVYNEDWLFLIALALAGPDPRHALGWAGRVHQQPYEPFRERRARSEEAGEVIGEGLMNRLEDLGRGMLEDLGRAQWREFLKARLHLIHEMRSYLSGAIETERSPGRQRQLRRIDRVLGVAGRVSRKLKPADLQIYVETWVADHSPWHERLLVLASNPFELLPHDDPILVELRAAGQPRPIDRPAEPADGSAEPALGLLPRPRAQSGVVRSCLRVLAALS
jgi:hypothetical protein